MRRVGQLIPEIGNTRSRTTKRTALVTMCKEKPERPPLPTKPRKAHCTKPKLFTLTAMRKAMAESQVLLTIGASNKLAPILEKNRIDN